MAKVTIDKIITPVFRVSFPEVFKAKSFQGGRPKFSVVALFKADENIDSLKDLAKRAIARFKDWGVNQPTDLKTPFKDGNLKDYAGYKDTIYCTFSAYESYTDPKTGMTYNFQPGVVDETKEAIIDTKDYYAGCYSVASITAFAYDTAGNKGVSFGLRHVMKVNDGDPLTGGESAESAFESIPLPDGGVMGVEGGEKSVLDIL